MIDLSIIIPVYKPERQSLIRCLQSVLEGCRYNIEVILVDDGGLDLYRDLWYEIEQQDSRILLVHQAHAGVSVARNRGLSVANGRYIAFVDCDDVVAEQWHDLAISKADEVQADIVYGRVLMCTTIPERYSNNKDTQWKVYDESNKNIIRRELMLNKSCLIKGLNYLDHGPCAKLFRKSILEGVRFPENLAYSEDQVFNHRVLANASIYLVTNNLAYYYISNPESTTHKIGQGVADAMVYSLQLIMDTIPNVDTVRGPFSMRIVFDIWMGFRMEGNGSIKSGIRLKDAYARWCQLRSVPLVKWAMSCPTGKLPCSIKHRLKFLLIKYFPQTTILAITFFK